MVIANCCRILRPSFFLRRKSRKFPRTESSPPPSSPLRCLFFFLFFSRHHPALLLSLQLNPGWLDGEAPPSKNLTAHFLAPQELSCVWNAPNLKLHAIYLTWLLQGTSSPSWQQFLCNLEMAASFLCLAVQLAWDASDAIESNEMVVLVVEEQPDEVMVEGKLALPCICIMNWTQPVSRFGTLHYHS